MKNFGVFQLRDSGPDIVTIDKAVVAYRQKYADTPNVCYFNSERFPFDFVQDDLKNIRIKTSPLVHPSMIWVGQEEE